MFHGILILAIPVAIRLQTRKKFNIKAFAGKPKVIHKMSDYRANKSEEQAKNQEQKERSKQECLKSLTKVIISQSENRHGEGEFLGVELICKPNMGIPES